MTYRILLTFMALFAVSWMSMAQDIGYARSILDTLTSPSMHGRGYVNDGHKKAAEYIAGEFDKLKLVNLADGYIQSFPININTFPGKIKLKIDDKVLTPGSDFIVAPNSSSVSRTFECVLFQKSILDDKKCLRKFRKVNLHDKVLVISDEGLPEKDKAEFMYYMKTNPWNARGIIVPVDKLTHGLSTKADSYFAIEVLKGRLPEACEEIMVEIENNLKLNDTTQNVIGYIKGKANPDSLMVFTAHYDHLGRMGEDIYFPGANDNASGTAMLIDLARHYSQPENQPDHSIVFIAFGAEEAGLLGSKYFTENPLFELNRIKFLINLDIVGTGGEGITVVNAPTHIKEFNLLQQINEENDYLPQVKKRGQTKNSDHYPFSEKGIPAFFIYTMGGIKAYHDVFDKVETLPLTEYEDLFRLLTGFVDAL